MRFPPWSRLSWARRLLRPSMSLLLVGLMAVLSLTAFITLRSHQMAGQTRQKLGSVGPLGQPDHVPRLGKLRLLDNPIFGPLDHVGVVTTDATALQGTMSGGLGTVFCSAQSITASLFIEPHFGASGTYTIGETVSQNGPPHYELVESVPHTFLAASKQLPVMELGYVVGDANLAQAGNLLMNGGMTFVATIYVGQSDPPKNPVGVAWYQAAPGVLIELLGTDPTNC